MIACMYRHTAVSPLTVCVGTLLLLRYNYGWYSAPSLAGFKFEDIDNVRHGLYLCAERDNPETDNELYSWSILFNFNVNVIEFYIIIQ